ncbi:MAG: hypothetical protein M3Z89_14575 [Lysinibacillus fusiformis]|uniref:hypothetical protein n=1 Tax=Lysinibacillus fusiformis TaxID=28031 RepID=UPI0023A92DB1|nr:hypothetical protein [Lysinibacillus fusiformis]MCT6929263.1 hypothetical protein [Lysinibacillus fusiformis]MCT6933658.1 hypothetical protein [Lysinibacillus fusiformis]WEA39173.1 hypothetical protein PWJ66_21645 [Lysinibacillus fusiformis]
MKTFGAPYSYMLVALASLIGLINYFNKSTLLIVLLSISLIGSLFLIYWDRDKLHKKGNNVK